MSDRDDRPAESTPPDAYRQTHAIRAIVCDQALRAIEATEALLRAAGLPVRRPDVIEALILDADPSRAAARLARAHRACDDDPRHSQEDGEGGGLVRHVRALRHLVGERLDAARRDLDHGLDALLRHDSGEK